MTDDEIDALIRSVMNEDWDNYPIDKMDRILVRAGIAAERARWEPVLRALVAWHDKGGYGDAELTACLAAARAALKE